MSGPGDIDLMGEVLESNSELSVSYHSHDAVAMTQIETEPEISSILGKRKVDELDEVSKVDNSPTVQIIGQLIIYSGMVTRKIGDHMPFTPYPYVPSSSIFTAISDCDLSQVQVLVAAGVDINSRAFALQDTPLMHASTQENSYEELEIIEFLLTNGSDINAKNKRGDTALIRACMMSKIYAVRSFIVAGADVNVQNKDGDTALMFAVRTYYGESWSRGNSSIIGMLLDNGADMHILNNEGESALTRARFLPCREAYFIAHQGTLDNLATFIKEEFFDKAESDVKGKGYKFFEAYQRLSKNDLKASCQKLGIADVDRAFAKVDHHILNHAAEISLIAKHPDGQFIDTTGRRVTIPEDVMKHVFAYLKLSDIKHRFPPTRD